MLLPLLGRSFFRQSCCQSLRGTGCLDAWFVVGGERARWWKCWGGDRCVFSCPVVRIRCFDKEKKVSKGDCTDL